MTKKMLFWLGLSAGVMMLLPWAVTACVPPNAAMTATLLLFFGIDPACCMAAGYCAGKQIHRLWWVPAVTAALFLAGAWLFLEMWEPEFLTYAGIYFAVGMEAMLVSRLITGRRENKG